MKNINFKLISGVFILLFAIMIVGTDLGAEYLTDAGLMSTIDIADSKDSMQGISYLQSGEVYYGDNEVSQDSNLFAVFQTSSELCAGQKSYLTYYAFPTGSGSEYVINEKAFYDMNKNGYNCQIRQTIIYDGGTFAGSWHDVNYVYYTAPSYSAGQLYVYVLNPQTIYIQIEGKCDEASYWGTRLLDSKSFVIKNCATDDEQDIINCEAQSTTYCSNGYETDKVCTYSYGQCSCQVQYSTATKTTACQIELCSDQNKYWYDGSCHSSPYVEPTPDVPDTPDIPDVPELTDEQACLQQGFYWYDNGCHSTLGTDDTEDDDFTEYLKDKFNWDEYKYIYVGATGILTLIVGGIGIIILALIIKKWVLKK